MFLLPPPKEAECSPKIVKKAHLYSTRSPGDLSRLAFGETGVNLGLAEFLKYLSTQFYVFIMKTYFKILAILFVTLNFSCTSQRQVSAQQGSMSFQVFYDELSPYGQWVDYPNYGYVWIPDVNADFAPYSTDGYWVMTNYGWIWASDYDWGWAAFHYGRWDFDNSYGWFWVPGNEWGSSWVIWRQSEGYYGWTPMRPGMNINMSFGNGYRDIDRWYFVPARYFGRSDMNRYYVDRNVNNVIIINSTVINNTYIDKSRNTTYISGPRRADVQRTTGRSINNVTIRNNDKPGQRLTNNQLQIYRPQVQQNNGTTRKATPTRVTNISDVRPTKDRNTSTQPNVRTPNQNNNREGQLPVQQKEIIRQPQQQQQNRPINEQQQPVERQQQPEQRVPEKQQPTRQVEEQKTRQNQTQPQKVEKERQGNKNEADTKNNKRNTGNRK